MDKILNFFRRDTKHVEQLRDLLGNFNNVETFLGIKESVIPAQEQIRSDATKLLNYSRSGDYKVFADEAWSRVMSHLDVMMDSRSSKDLVDFHRGACKEALDLLRLSYQARALLVNDREQSVSQPR